MDAKCDRSPSRVQNMLVRKAPRTVRKPEDTHPATGKDSWRTGEGRGEIRTTAGDVLLTNRSHGSLSFLTTTPQQLEVSDGRQVQL